MALANATTKKNNISASPFFITKKKLTLIIKALKAARISQRDQKVPVRA